MLFEINFTWNEDGTDVTATVEPTTASGFGLFDDGWQFVDVLVSF